MQGKKKERWGRPLWMVGLLCAVTGLSVSFINGPADSRGAEEETHRQLALRSVGHRLLLLEGDLASPLPPVTSYEPGSYLLKFPSAISLHPDSLYAIVAEALQQYHLSEPYQLQVLRCADQALMYGYEIGPNSPDEISCTGRALDTNCYRIQIRFLETKTSVLATLQPWLFGGALLALGLVGLVGFRVRDSKKAIPDAAPSQGDVLEDVQFFFAENRLVTPAGNTPLSDKESKVLQILFRSQDALVTRDQLLKEGWEDEGVYTSRSLDMFISKLRKKLSGSGRVVIVTVRGQGYKLTKVSD
ncbi:MAG: helix-turn-helix domain-containing protein [Bacteroidota bacterium]